MAEPKPGPLDAAFRVVIATRASPLARRQAGLVAEALRRSHAGIEVELHEVTTRGDRDRRPFAELAGRAPFMAEVERAVLEGRADVAVHSAKDLTAELADGAELVCVPDRARPGDVVVGGRGFSGEERLGSLGPGARVGTSSSRRRALLAEARPDLELVELRGNVGTRLARVEAGEVDAAVLAAAGLERLGAWDGGELDPSWWVPAPGQGTLAVEAAAGRRDLAGLFGPLNDPGAWAELACERAFAARLEGGCSVPLGCLARYQPTGIVATGFVGAADGSRGLRDRISGPAAEAGRLGAELAEALLDSGGDDILAEARTA